MGLHIEVYKNGKWDCTNGGVTSGDIKGLCIENVSGPFNPSEDYPAATSDSRFSEKVEEMMGTPFYGALAIHDRVE